ncbi:dehalogenase [Mucilaginibacter sp. PPCGB 2223]|uniref:HAD family hydrolase n=1 Tax=Mucilaginibacter sp. PPCGB 2223 TaxID=1886027 RepID=UPI000824155E|nr:HAD family hydrolase [Mucilaginibacter sp. PPCGB 2223]OCX52302.1 dehalogenase [Mucilaginibacter sp. PPCGB 2223]
MPAYQHYSFDLWLTLIRSNPLFKQQRASYFHQHYNSLHKPLEEVERIFRQVDQLGNSINEATGKNIGADELYLMAISLINDGQIALTDIGLPVLFADMEALLFKYMPLLYSDDTAPVLSQLKQTGCTMSILSNTGFIKGSTLCKVLNELGIGRYFDFQLYSDEAGLSKPNKAFFRLMLDEISALRYVPLDQIIHIGDNPRADIEGAQSVGINSLLVNSNDIAIKKLIYDAAQHLFVT